MLGRRILRIKAFKAVFSYSENRTLSLAEIQRQLDKSCEATRDLYLFMLALPLALTEEARMRMEAVRSKFSATEEERNPNLKFIRNAVVPLLASDPDFTKIVEKKKISWEQYDVLLRHLYDSMRGKDYFKSYMASPSSGIKEDAELFIRFYEEELVDSTELSDILEDLNIWWNDDLAYALTWDCRTMADLAKGKRWSFPELYQSEMKRDSRMEDDRAFVRELLRSAVCGFEKFYAAIEGNTPKWDTNRICATDLALIVCGLAEADAFPSTPARIIINEYVEISKFYSTPESRAFVNGLLDKLINKSI